jgi:hypothetical protein
MQVAGDVVPARRRNSVDEDGLGAGVDQVIVAEDEPRHAIDRLVRGIELALTARRTAFVRVVQVDVVLIGERGVDGDPHETTLYVRAQAASEVYRGRRIQSAILVNQDLAELGRDQDSPVWHRGDAGRARDPREQLILKARRNRRLGSGREESADREQACEQPKPNLHATDLPIRLARLMSPAKVAILPTIH